MKTVFFDIQYLLKNKTGIEQYTFNILQNLISTKKILALGGAFTKNISNQPEINLEFDELIFNNKIDYRLYRIFNNFYKQSYDEIFKKADIYHFFNHFIPPIKSKSAKIIFNVYDNVIYYFPKTMDKKAFILLKSDFQKYINRADHIITISNYIKDDIKRIYNYPSEKITVIYPEISDLYKKYSPIYENNKLNSNYVYQIQTKFNINKKYFLFIGTIEPRKNIEFIINGYLNLPESIKKEYDLIIAGRIGWKSKKVLKLINKNKKNIKYLNYISDFEKIVLQNSASLFLYPSLYEGFGIPIIESLSLGIPVIASKNSGMIEAGGNLVKYIDPNNSDDFIKNIILEVSQNKKNKLNFQDINDHFKKFNWLENSKKILDIYSEN